MPTPPRKCVYAPGREWDAETGLWYYRARWYDAETGQFLSEDPLAFAAGDANLKRYVFNSPPNWTDPSGLSGSGGDGGEGGSGGSSEPSGGGFDVYNPYGPSGGYWPMPSQSSAGGGWLDNYSNWFNNTFGGGWSQTVGAGIYTGLVGSGLVSDETLANTSDTTLLAGTAVAATGIVVGGYYGIPAAIAGVNTATTTGYVYISTYAPGVITFAQSPLGWGTISALGFGYFNDWDWQYMVVGFFTGALLNPGIYGPTNPPPNRPNPPSSSGPPPGPIWPRPGGGGWSSPSAPPSNPAPQNPVGWAPPHGPGQGSHPSAPRW